MKLQEINRPKTRIDAHHILIKAGYQWIGKGKWGRVYRKADDPYVLKLFSSTDNAYLAYLALVKNHPNPHFPKVIGKLIKVTSEYYAVRLEPLEQIFISERAYYFGEISRTYIKGIGLEDVIDGVKIDADNFHLLKILDARDYMEEHPDVKEACDLIGSLLSRFSLDIEDRNIMLRGKTFVFTDPVYDPSV